MTQAPEPTIQELLVTAARMRLNAAVSQCARFPFELLTSDHVEAKGLLASLTVGSDGWSAAQTTKVNAYEAHRELANALESHRVAQASLSLSVKEKSTETLGQNGNHEA